MPDNVLIHEGVASVIDFDDCGFGWYLYDPHLQPRVRQSLLAVVVIERDHLLFEEVVEGGRVRVVLHLVVVVLAVVADHPAILAVITFGPPAVADAQVDGPVHGRLRVIRREHPQAPGVDAEALVYSELRADVGDWTGVVAWIPGGELGLPLEIDVPVEIPHHAPVVRHERPAAIGQNRLPVARLDVDQQLDGIPVDGPKLGVDPGEETARAESSTTRGCRRALGAERAPPGPRCPRSRRVRWAWPTSPHRSGRAAKDCRKSPWRKAGCRSRSGRRPGGTPGAAAGSAKAASDEIPKGGGGRVPLWPLHLCATSSGPHRRTGLEIAAGRDCPNRRTSRLAEQPPMAAVALRSRGVRSRPARAGPVPALRVERDRPVAYSMTSRLEHLILAPWSRSQARQRSETAS